MRVIVGLASLLGLVSSCSLLGLDQVRVQPCDQCEALNVRDGLTGCEIWQCEASGRYCVLGAPDRDGDLDVRADCGGTDCDDENPSVAGTADELCDGIDNDCNGLVDDGSIMDAEPASTVVSGVVSPAAIAIAPAVDQGVLLSWRQGVSTSMARVTGLDAAVAVELTSVTNADVSQPLTSSDTAAGCARRNIISLRALPCGAGDSCPGAQRCVTAPDGARICEGTVVNRDPPAIGECLTHASCQDGITCNGIEQCDPLSPLSDSSTGCRAAAPPCDAGDRCDEDLDACLGTVVVGTCAPDELAIAPASETEWIAASIDASASCPSGEVRLGSLAPSPPVFREWGDGRLSTAWPLVEADQNGCTRAAGIVGASSISLAVLPADPSFGQLLTEGLAAWRAEPFCDEGTCSGPAEVALLGLWRERSSGAGATDITWVNAAGDGHPTVLADAAIAEDLAIDAYRVGSGADRHAGYVVGYASSLGVTLALVPALGAPHLTCAEGGPPCLERLPGPDGVLGTADDPEPSTRFGDLSSAAPRTSIPQGPPRIELLSAGAAVQAIGLAVGTEGDDVPILVAWATGSELVLVLVREDPSEATLVEGERVRVTGSGILDLSVTHLEEGLTVARPGGPEARGGWVVTWSSDVGTFALRVGENGEVIEPGAVVLSPSPSRAPRAFLDRGAGTAASVRVVAHQGDGFVVFPSACGPSL